MGASEDAFVYEPLDDDLSPSYPPSQQSASPSRPYFLPLSILSSTLAAFSLAHLALHSQLTVLFALVPAQLLVLVLFAGAEVWWTSRKRHAEAGGCGLDGRWKEISLHGAALALGSFLLIWGARLVHPIVWTGLEVLLLPAAILAAGECYTSRATHISLLAPLLVGLSLFNKSASLPGSLGVVVSVALQSARRRFASPAEAQPHFFFWTSVIASVLSATIYATLLLSSLLADEWYSRIDASDVISIITLVVAAPVAQFTSHASSQSTPSPPLEILSRNLAFLLLWTIIGSRSYELAGAWLPFLLIYGFGSLFAFDIDRSLTNFAEPLLGVISRLHHRNLALPSSPTLSRSHPSSCSDSASSSSLPSTLPTRFVLLSLTPFLLWILLLPFSPARSPSPLCTYFPASLSPIHCSLLGTVDVVISYYDEPPSKVRDMIAHLRMIDFISVRKSRFLVYTKGGQDPGTLKAQLGVDEVIPLENVGREGATYLRHILSHYPSSALALSSALRHPSLVPSPAGLADHTFFFQHHVSWGSMGRRRAELVVGSTGFLSFGPYHTIECGGEDTGTGSYPHVTDIYETFRGEVCPKDREQLIAWAAQFVVSKRRVLANDLKHYQALSDTIEAPADHWIHQEWGPNNSGGPSNPTFGHSVERAWPIIFNCVDPAIAARCDERTWNVAKCQCLD